MIDILHEGSIVPHLRATSKKQVLQELSKRAAALTGEHERAILDVLLERERLGTTGVGHGVAIPHARLARLPQVYGVLARLDSPVDFDSIDDQPVDLVFLLLAPENAGADHLKALSRVSRLLRDDGLCAKLRGCETGDAMFALVSDDINARAA